MATWTDIRREMLRVDARLGRIHPISALTGTTVVASAYATGGVPANEQVGRWLVRAEATDVADFARRCTAFATATGTWTHAGTAYADTTATNEEVEVLSYEPYLYANAIRAAIKGMLLAYPVMLPGVRRGEYWLNDLDWLRAPGDIARVVARQSPGLIRNTKFEDWYTYQSDGDLLPDYWTPSGTVVVPRTASELRRGGWCLSDTTTGGVITYTQTGDLGINGAAAANGEDLRGQAVTMFARVKSSTATQVRIGIDDGVTVTYSTYHTGGGAYEELAVEKTLSSAALYLKFIIYRANTAGAFVVDQVDALKGDAVTDEIRRDVYPENELSAADYEWRQGGKVLLVPRMGQNYQVWIHARRRYPWPDALDALLVSNGIEAVQILADRETVALGARARLYEALGDTEMAATLARKFDRAAAAQLYEPSALRGGVEIIPRTLLSPMPRR